MVEIIARLVRMRWFVALLALCGFLFGFIGGARAASPPNWSCVHDDIPLTGTDRHCDQGLAYLLVSDFKAWRESINTGWDKEYYSFEISSVQYPPGSDYLGLFRVIEKDSRLTYSSNRESAQYTRLCSARPDIPGLQAPEGGGGRGCFDGCVYEMTINVGGAAGTPLTTMFATGEVCGVAMNMVPGGNYPDDPCEANPSSSGCSPGEPGDDGDDGDDGDGDNGAFPGGGGTPGSGSSGGSNPWGGGGSSPGEGQLCGGPNQVPCNMTLGTATLPASCKQPPTCTGDPVACGILYTTWRTACNSDLQPEWTKVTGDGTEGAGPDPEGDQILRTVTLDPTSRLDQSGFGGSGSCPSLGTINFKIGRLAKVVNFDALDWWCPMLGWVRGFMYLLGAFVGVGILVGGKS